MENQPTPRHPFLQFLEKRRISFSVVAALIFTLLPSIFAGYLFWLHAFPTFKSLRSTAQELVTQIYPEELTVAIKNGQVSTNVSEPYYIVVEDDLLERTFKFDLDESGNTKIRILAIDTKANPSQFENYQALSLLTSDSFVYYNDGSVKVQSLREMDDVVITKTWLLDELNKALDEVNFEYLANFLVILVPLVVALMLLIYGVLQVLTYLFFTFVISRSMGKKIELTKFIPTLLLLITPGSLLLLLLSLSSLFGIIIPDWLTPILDKVHFMVILSILYVLFSQDLTTSLTPRKVLVPFCQALLFLPALLILSVLRSPRTIVKKLILIAVIVLTLVTAWLSTYQLMYQTSRGTLHEQGYISEPLKVTVSGTSMLPGIKDGQEVELMSSKRETLERGDVVSFSNEKTDFTHYLKRIIALPGETFSLRNGTVFINNQALKESYTLNNLPTFGNTALMECRDYQVPEGSYIVLGDNRTISSDSRLLSFIAKDEIDGVIKGQAPEFLSATEQQAVEKVAVTQSQLLAAVNGMRDEASMSAQTANTTLNAIAQERATFIRDNPNDWKTKITQLSAEADKKGYRYNSVHEFVTYGYLTADQIVEQIKDSESEFQAFTDSQAHHLGIGIVEQENGSCSYPLIVMISAWPVSPEYSAAELESLQGNLESTTSLAAFLQRFVGDSSRDQDKLRQLITMNADRHRLSTQIYNKMTSKQWLTAQDYTQLERYHQATPQFNQLLVEVFPEFFGIIE